MHKLIDQAGLAYTRFPYQGYELPMARASVRQRLLQRHQFVLPPHEPGEPPPRGGL